MRLIIENVRDIPHCCLTLSDLWSECARFWANIDSVSKHHFKVQNLRINVRDGCFHYFCLDAVTVIRSWACLPPWAKKYIVVRINDCVRDSCCSVAFLWTYACLWGYIMARLILWSVTRCPNRAESWESLVLLSCKSSYNLVLSRFQLAASFIQFHIGYTLHV